MRFTDRQKSLMRVMSCGAGYAVSTACWVFILTGEYPRGLEDSAWRRTFESLLRKKVVERRSKAARSEPAQHTWRINRKGMLIVLRWLALSQRRSS